MLGPTKHAQHEIRMGEPTKTCSKCQAWKGQLGLEPTPELYIEHLTEIFNEVKRVLKKEGTLWLNIGDTYSGGCMTGKQGKTSTTGINRGQGEATNLPPRKPPIGLPSKCLLMVPERLAWALIQDDRDDEYELRSDLTNKEQEYVLSEIKKYRCREGKNHNGR